MINKKVKGGVHLKISLKMFFITLIIVESMMVI